MSTIINYEHITHCQIIQWLVILHIPIKHNQFAIPEIILPPALDGCGLREILER
jgi:hypothetical protein